MGKEKRLKVSLRSHKNKFLSVILMITMTLTSASCSSGTKETSVSETTSIAASSTEEEKTIREGKINVADDPNFKNKKKISVQRDGIELTGILYLPEGDGPFPVVIFAGGMGAGHEYLADIAKEQSDNGITAVIFSFAGDKDLKELTARKEIADLKAVIGAVRTLNYIDSSRVFLWGHSFGGLIASYVGCRFPDEIRGMMLVEPAYPLKDQISKDYPNPADVPENVYSKQFIEDLYSFDIYEYMPSFKGNVTIFLGTTQRASGTTSPEHFERAKNTYPSCELVRIEGANHDFQVKGRDELIKGTTEFIKKNI